MHLNMRRQGSGGSLLGWIVRWARWVGGMKVGELGGDGEKERGSGIGQVGGTNDTPTTTTTAATTTTTTTHQTQLIPPIPPTSNPRGELIFSSRVSPHFKEGYERYRAAFERRRGEKIREERWRKSWFFVRWFLDPPENKSGATPGTAAGHGHGKRGGSLGVNMQGQRSRSTSPAVPPSNSTVNSNTLTTTDERRLGGLRRSGSDVDSPRLEPPRHPVEKDTSSSMSEEKVPLVKPVTAQPEREARIKRERSESYTFILGKGEVDKHTMGGVKRESMGRVDEEKR